MDAGPALENFGVDVLILSMLVGAAFAGVMMWQLSKLWILSQSTDHRSPAEQKISRLGGAPEVLVGRGLRGQRTSELLLVASNAMTRPQTERSSRVAKPGSSLVYFIFAGLAVPAVLAMPVYQYLSVGSGAWYSCFMGPVPPGAVSVGASGPVDAYKTTIPAGRYCEWQNAAGEPLAYQTGWITTIVACAATLLILWMTVLVVRENRPRRLLTTLIPAMLTLLGWIAIFI